MKMKPANAEKKINQASEFHGAMDGAIRFTQRDAVASIIIVAVNIIAGFAIGVLQFGKPIAEALKPTRFLRLAMAWQPQFHHFSSRLPRRLLLHARRPNQHQR